MVLFVKKSTKLLRTSNPKLDQSESKALKCFQSYLSESLNRLLSDKRHGSLSLSWFIPCFNFLQEINRAFTKLVKDLDHPFTKWKGDLAEDYLSHSLNILDALNSISSSISHLGNSRLTLCHAVSLIPNSSSSALHHLKPIKPRKIEPGNCKKKGVESFDCDKERAIYEAMVKLKGVNLVVFRVLLCGVSDGSVDHLGLLNSSELEGFDLGFGGNLMVKEIEEVNVTVKEVEDGLIEGRKSSNSKLAAEELKNKLGELENLLEMVNKEVNCLFSEVLARRSELINCLRLCKSNN
ncbi:hypothetical protein SOVF_127860 [Spinacia oleracea]|uniref:Protein BPS1, chloroplastic-like n=1 Tax=Spinacia oleracea TaxID=3562 RepID=A0A9R0JDV4_SPIOL|nr:protein BPS1, chloroplastic-like [Spinacia oleracea]KNA12225.1 hypothetical protein SOVF_127860 [Spinacia oleracea]